MTNEYANLNVRVDLFKGFKGDLRISLSELRTALALIGTDGTTSTVSGINGIIHLNIIDSMCSATQSSVPYSSGNGVREQPSSPATIQSNDKFISGRGECLKLRPTRSVEFVPLKSGNSTADDYCKLRGNSVPGISLKGSPMPISPDLPKSTRHPLNPNQCELGRSSLCSSLTEDDWHSATHAFRPLVQWTPDDAAFWASSFEPLRKYANRFQELGIDGKKIIKLVIDEGISNHFELSESEVSIKLLPLFAALKVGFKAHRKLLAVELCVLIRMCHLSNGQQAISPASLNSVSPRHAIISPVSSFQNHDPKLAPMDREDRNIEQMEPFSRRSMNTSLSTSFRQSVYPDTVNLVSSLDDVDFGGLENLLFKSSYSNGDLNYAHRRIVMSTSPRSLRSKKADSTSSSASSQSASIESRASMRASIVVDGFPEQNPDPDALSHTMNISGHDLCFSHGLELKAPISIRNTKRPSSIARYASIDPSSLSPSASGHWNEKSRGYGSVSFNNAPSAADLTSASKIPAQQQHQNEFIHFRNRVAPCFQPRGILSSVEAEGFDSLHGARCIANESVQMMSPAQQLSEQKRRSTQIRERQNAEKQNIQEQSASRSSSRQLSSQFSRSYINSTKETKSTKESHTCMGSSNDYKTHNETFGVPFMLPSVPMSSINDRTSDLRRPLFPAPFMTSVPNAYPEKSLSEHATSSSTASSSTVVSTSRNISKKEISAPKPASGEISGSLFIDIDAVNAEASDNFEASYEYTEAGSLITDGFRINSTGIIKTPSQSRVLLTAAVSSTRNIFGNVGSNDQPKNCKTNPWGHMRSGLMLLEELGRGAAGTVRKALFVPNLLLVAIKSVPVHEDNRRRQLLRELHSLYNVGNAMLGSGMPPRRRAEIAHSLGDIDEIRALGGFDDVDGAGDMGVGPEQVEKYDDDDALNTSFDSHETMPATPPRWRRHEPTAVIIPKIVPGTVAVAPETTIRMPPLRPVKQNSHTGDSARKRADEPREQRHSETRERCAHIVSIYDAFTDPESGSVCLVLEFMNAGSLQELIASKASNPIGFIIPEALIATVAEAVLLGLRVIHSKHQIHRDIKPANILLDCGNNVKISDFGIAKELDSISLANSFTGTLVYMSPERIRGDDYSYSSDVWSLGLCLMALAEGKVPLPTQLGYWAVVRAIQEDPSPTLSTPPRGHPQWSAAFQDFISKCLDKDPVTRLLPGKLLDHPFLTVNRATLSNLSSSPPVKPTVSLIAHVRQLAKAAADWHVGQNGASNGDIVTSIHTTFVEGTNQSSRRHALPDMSKIDSLARQLNIPVEAVDDTFREEWRCRGWIS